MQDTNNLPKIKIGLAYYRDDGWCATAECGEGKLYAYDRGYSQPEQALFEIILELARIRAHVYSESTDYLSKNDEAFRDVVLLRGIFD